MPDILSSTRDAMGKSKDKIPRSWIFILAGGEVQRVSDLNTKHNIAEDLLCFTGYREGDKKEQPHFCLLHPSVPLSSSKEPADLPLV